jgi:tetratricopeptide (TPR) repeat protein
MRVAIVVSPWDQDASDAGTWSDAVAWLGASLAKMGFRVAVVDGVEDVQADLVRALEGLSQDDSVLLHVSGHLARRGVLRVAGGRWLPLRSVGEALAALSVADVSVFAELVHEDEADDALVAADHVASIVSAIGARERGYGMVAAVRPATTAVEGVPFTKLFFDVAAASDRADALLSSLYARVTAMPESMATAQSFTLVRGRAELELAAPPPPPAELDALVDAATEAKEWDRVVALRRQRLASHASPRHKGKELVAIARVLQQELGDAERAVATLEEARALEPRRAPVLQALRRGYEILGRWASAIEVTGALADLAPMPVDRAALRYAQARMTLDHLQDEERAVAWLEQAVEDDPSHTEACTLLTRLRSSLTPPEPMPVPEELVADTGPRPAFESGERPTGERPTDEMDPETHRFVFAERMAAGRLDAAFLSALALEELGALDAQQAALVGQLRSVAPLRARGMLDAAGWAQLVPYGMDDVLTALFGAVARAGALARVEQLVARGRLVALDPTARLDDASTASVVRSFQWAARVLGVPCPDLYVVPEVPGEIAAVRAHEHSTAVGPSIVSGRSAKDLAFLAGRHLTYYRREHQVLVYFPTRDELTRLLLAAVQLTKPGITPSGEGSRAVAALAARLENHISEPELDDLTQAVRQLELRGGKFSMSAWTRNVELMAARAGLLLCGDLATAMAIVSNESREIAGLTLDAKRRDLMAFGSSEEHAALRARFAGASPESVRPPPPSSVAYSP